LEIDVDAWMFQKKFHNARVSIMCGCMKCRATAGGIVDIAVLNAEKENNDGALACCDGFAECGEATTIWQVDVETVDRKEVLNDGNLAEFGRDVDGGVAFVGEEIGEKGWIGA
jgi:hypothetical protein